MAAAASNRLAVNSRRLIGRLHRPEIYRQPGRKRNNFPNASQRLAEDAADGLCNWYVVHKVHCGNWQRPAEHSRGSAVITGKPV